MSSDEPANPHRLGHRGDRRRTGTAMMIGYPAFPEGWVPLVVEASRVTGSETLDRVVAAIKLAMRRMEEDPSSWFQGILTDEDAWGLCRLVLTELGWACGEDGAWRKLAASGART